MMHDAPPFLVIQLARFGDLVQTGRLLATAQARGETHLLVDHGLVPLARLLHPGVVVHGATAHRPPDARDMGATVATLDALREVGFRTVAACNHSPLSTAIASFFPESAHRGHGWHAGQATRSPWLTLAFRSAGRRRQAALNLVDLWAHLLDDPLPPERTHPAAAPKGGGLGVVLAGRHARRSLPMPVLAPCVAALAHRLGRNRTRVHLLGGVAESPAARELLRLLPPALQDATTDWTGRTDWAGLVDLVGGLDLVLTPDTGTMHLAARLGVPVEATFLSSAWAWETGPYGEGHVIWQTARDCSPCLESRPCPCGVACLSPYGERSFLRLLTGGSGDPPPGLLRLETRRDPLGQLCEATAGVDPEAAARSLWRGLLMADRQLADVLPPEAAPLAAILYQEPDWRLGGLALTEAV